MSDELSGVTIVLIIGGGAILSVMLFIFAKRQIMRFAIRSRRGPHVPIGHDAKKSLKKEIERKIEVIPKIHNEPRLITDDRYIMNPGEQLPPYYYRLKAVDDVKLLEAEISKQDSGLFRHPSESLRAYLLTILSPALNEQGQKLIHQFCDMYEHARHDPNDFQDEEYQQYHRLLLKLLDAAKQLKSFSSSRKTSPSRTPRKQQDKQIRSLLDPSRLRPPYVQQSRLKLALNEDEVLSIETRPAISLSISPATVEANDNETSV